MNETKRDGKRTMKAIARILKEKRPKAFMLENVKQLRGHDKADTRMAYSLLLSLPLPYSLHGFRTENFGKSYSAAL